MTASSLVSLQGIAQTFANGVTALRDFDLDLRAGEFVSLLGPSGCGKSSALRLIAGLASPTAGALQWRAGERPAIGFVFQDATLMPWATIFENVWLPLRLKHVSRADATPAISEALARVGLGAFADAFPRELSGGMKMRVSIARALVLRPALLLMDEPFAALDEITRLRLNRDLLALQAERGMTVLFVTHSVYESAFLSSRICVFSERPGRIVTQIDISAPAPRDESYRLSSAYLETCRVASQALEDVMAQPA
ncbi:MAG: nitrate transporter ATPase [Hyphomicrobiales bacterium]|nr:nitrate transporter ATPase [Hyphomicrobiales bacterium]